jgi:Putative threonine/serine exporter
MSDPQPHTNLLLNAGRLLLEYNESTGAIHHALTAAAPAITDETCRVMVSYRNVAVSVGNEAPAMKPIMEFRYNTAVLARVHEILGQVHRGELDEKAALACLETQILRSESNGSD